MLTVRMMKKRNVKSNLKSNVKNRKGFVAILEMIIVVIALFVAFQIFFPGFSYKNRWEDALLMLKGRDLILVMERIGKLHYYSYNDSATASFLETLIPFSKTNIIGWSESEGSVKNRISIACMNCTDEQMVKLANWFRGLKINGKPIDMVSTICPTNLETINPCEKNADVLLVWGYKKLDEAKYVNTMRDYLKLDNGIVEVMDFTAASDLDSPVQQKIFGLKWETSAVSGTLKYENFTQKPDNATDVLYGPYKFFYHIPIPVEAAGSEAVAGCTFTASNKGIFKVNNTQYRFWICTGSSVKFDEDGNNAPDKTVVVGNYFSLNSSNFYLNYIDITPEKNRTGISFRSDFKFREFLDDGSITKIYQFDNDARKILLKADAKYVNGNYLPAIILNNSEGARIAWMADFKDYDDYEYRTMLASLLLWASNKRAIGILSPNVKVGFRTSYVNTVNDDMFEVYKYNLGLGYPY